MKKKLSNKELNKTAGGNYRSVITIDGVTYTATRCIEAADLKQEYLIKAGLKIKKRTEVVIIGPTGVYKATPTGVYKATILNKKDGAN